MRPWAELLGFCPAWVGQGGAGWDRREVNSHSTTNYRTPITCALSQASEQKCHNAKGKPHPSSFDQLPSEFFGGVVERELLTAQVVDWRVAFQVEEKVVVEKHLLWLLLT